MNHAIPLDSMMVIDPEGEKLGILTKLEAIAKAEQAELDLVLVSPNSVPPVARITNWDKFRYEKSKKNKKNSASKSAEIKEWWIKPTIGDRDLEIRLEKVKTFLKTGGNAKLTVKMFQNKGGIKVTPEDMHSTMNRLISIISEYASPMGDVQREGRNLSILIKLKK